MGPEWLLIGMAMNSRSSIWIFSKANIWMFDCKFIYLCHIWNNHISLLSTSFSTGNNLSANDFYHWCRPRISLFCGSVCGPICQKPLYKPAGCKHSHRWKLTSLILQFSLLTHAGSIVTVPYCFSINYWIPRTKFHRFVECKKRDSLVSKRGNPTGWTLMKLTVSPSPPTVQTYCT